MKFLSIGKDSVTLFFILGIMVLISSGIVAYLNSRDQLHSGDYIIEGYKSINIIESILSGISDAESSRRGYLLSGDKQHVINIENLKFDIDSLFRNLRLNSANKTKQLQKTDTMYVLVNRLFDTFTESIEIQNRKGANNKALNTYREGSKVLASDIKSIAARFIKDELAAINSKHELADQSFRFTFYTIAGGIIVCCILFTAVFIILKKNSKSAGYDDEEITRKELEKIIRERTAELSEINNKLNLKISELQKKDEDLKKSEQYYKMMFEQAHDAIIIVDPENEIVLDVNRRACEIYGLKRGEFIGLSLRAISKNVKMDDENLKITLQKGFFHSFQTVHYNKNLNEMLMEINASIINFNGKKAILSINRDITDRVLMIH